MPIRTVRIAFWVLGVTAALLETWSSRFHIEPDGVNYLDVACAYLKADWGSAINGYWSPLYSWILAGVKWLFAPASYWESTSLHFTNLTFYLAAFVCFEFFFRSFIGLLASRFPDAIGPEGVPEWAWWVLGYTGYLTATLRLITLRADTPDMLLAALLFLASGTVLKIAESQPRTILHMKLGIVLGVGYLAKSVMFPIALVYLVTTMFARGGWKRPDPRAVAGVAAFLLVSAPFVTALSRAKKHLTFGETGRVAYINQVLGVTIPGNDPRTANAHHPIHRISENPAVYEYGDAPFSVTYPPWYDASYWYEGVGLRFGVWDQLRVVVRSFGKYFEILATEKEWVVGWLILAVFASDWREHWKRWVEIWFLWLPALAMAGIYALVLIESRYVSVPISIIWVGLFGTLPWNRMASTGRLGRAVIVSMAIIGSVTLVREQVPNLLSCLRTQVHTQWKVASEMQRWALHSGDRIAVVGHTNAADYWAHLAGLRITAEVPIEAMPAYWSASSENRVQIASELSARGIKGLVTSGAPLSSEGWQRLGDTDYYLLMPRRQAAGNARSQ